MPKKTPVSKKPASKKGKPEKAKPIKKNTKVEPLENITVQVKKGQGAHGVVDNILIPPKFAIQIAEEVAKRVGSTVARKPRRRSSPNKNLEGALFLDTSAIIDGRIFELIRIGAFYGNVVLLEGVLSELKNIADSKDDLKKERGRRALKELDSIKKVKGIKIHVLDKEFETLVVDERIIASAKKNKGRIVTCDYNLSKKAKISGVLSIDLYELANILKTTAIPGEEFFVKIIQKGKGEDQGVGYLPDGTMIVVERAERLQGKTVQVVVSRIIQTEAGKIFFAKIKENPSVTG